MSGATMLAMVIDAFGGPDMLHMAELPRPEPGPGDVRVHIDHASVNPADAKTRLGMLAKYITYRFPFVLGFDLAGTIDAVGSGVTRWKTGDRVFGTSRQGHGENGSYAQYAIASEAMLAPLPPDLSMAQGACLPTAGTTAVGALVDIGALHAGQTVLINGGAGGVGSIAVQIGRHLGARVLTTCSGHNADYVMDLGADAAIDYGTSDVVAAVRTLCPGGVDLVLDAVGLGTLLPRASEVVRRGGCYVEIETLVSEADPVEIARAAEAGVRIVSNMIAIGRLPDQLQMLADFAATGAIRAPVTMTVPLTGVAAAHRMIEAGHVRGKIAIRIAPPA